MTTTFSVTSDQIAASALKECGALDAGGTLSTEDATDTRFILNMLLKNYVTKGIALWRVVEVVVPLLANQTTYQIGPSAAGTGAVVTDRPLRIFNPFLRDSSTPANDTPLDLLSRQEYTDLGTKFNTSVVNGVWYQPLKTNGLLTVYPTPADATRSVHFYGQVALSDVILGSDVLDFPAEYALPFKWILCREIAGPYVTSEAKINRIDRFATKAELDIIAWGQEQESLYLQLENRGYGRS